MVWLPHRLANSTHPAAASATPPCPAKAQLLLGFPGMNFREPPASPSEEMKQEPEGQFELPPGGGFGR